jgi:hypothetical protein
VRVRTLHGELELENPFVRCGGYSAHWTLAPGDPIVQHELRVVASPAGDYRLLARPLPEPELWLETTVRVR